MAIKPPTPLKRLEQSKEAKLNPLGTPKYEHIDYAATIAIDKEVFTTIPGALYWHDSLDSSKVDTSSPVRPPMTILPSNISPKLIEVLMQQTFVEGNNANMFLHKFAFALLSMVEVTYDGDFRLRIKE